MRKKSEKLNAWARLTSTSRNHTTTSLKIHSGAVVHRAGNRFSSFTETQLPDEPPGGTHWERQATIIFH